MFAPHAPYTVADTTLKRIRQLADQLDVPVQTHLHETAGEIDDSISETGRRPIRRLDDLGLINPGLMAVHCHSTDRRRNRSPGTETGAA